MHEWLDASRDRIAQASGVDAAHLELTEQDVASLLDLARVAAHDSGDRTNAPLVCFLVGRTVGRNPDITLAELANVAASTTTET
ncbi:MAG TPA: DUF6457 domain-containing protein [Gaiellaceae bacterium]|nr:DUF6457 domain-containing protein [Gaiellaceae bacterium]